eukprot:SAG31_NODE_2744_length_5150_cov_4.544249_5_plen_218_part_00
MLALVKNYLGAISLDSEEDSVVALMSGADFYAAPRLSPDGGSLAWVEWNHPNMPWDETSLCVATVLTMGNLGQKCLVAGGAGKREAVMNPAWAPVPPGAENELYFISDATGWWNLWAANLDSSGSQSSTTGSDYKSTHILAKAGAEFGEPTWGLGGTPFSFLPGGDQILCSFHGPATNGSQLALIDLAAVVLFFDAKILTVAIHLRKRVAFSFHACM